MNIGLETLQVIWLTSSVLLSSCWRMLQYSLCSVSVVEQQLRLRRSGCSARTTTGQTHGRWQRRAVARRASPTVPAVRFEDVPAVSAQQELQLSELPESVNGPDLPHNTPGFWLAVYLCWIFMSQCYWHMHMCVCVMKGWGVQCRISPYECPSAPNDSDRLHRTVPLESTRRYWTDTHSCVSLTCPGQISSSMTFCSVEFKFLCVCLRRCGVCVWQQLSMAHP